MTLLVVFFLELASMKDTLDETTRQAALGHVVNITYTYGFLVLILSSNTTYMHAFLLPTLLATCTNNFLRVVVLLLLSIYTSACGSFAQLAGPYMAALYLASVRPCVHAVLLGLRV